MKDYTFISEHSQLTWTGAQASLDYAYFFVFLGVLENNACCVCMCLSQSIFSLSGSVAQNQDCSCIFQNEGYPLSKKPHLYRPFKLYASIVKDLIRQLSPFISSVKNVFNRQYSCVAYAVKNAQWLSLYLVLYYF